MKSFTRVALCLSAIVLAASTVRAQEMFTLTLPRVREALVRGDAQYATGWTIDCGYWDGSTKCSAKYPAGTTVILSGQSIASGFVWDGWGGDCASSTGGRCVLVMNANRNVKANVKTVGNATIKVSPITHGMIAGKTPTVGNDDVIQCPTGAKRCSFSITTGSTMRLFPFPELGYKTGSWTGACAGQGYECNLTLTGTMEVGYTFEPAPVSFAVVAPPNFISGLRITFRSRTQRSSSPTRPAPAAARTRRQSIRKSCSSSCRARDTSSKRGAATAPASAVPAHSR